MATLVGGYGVARGVTACAAGRGDGRMRAVATTSSWASGGKEGGMRAVRGVRVGRAWSRGVAWRGARARGGRRADHGAAVGYGYGRGCSSVAAAGGAVPGSGAGGALGVVKDTEAFLAAFWAFLRPHTIRGTILGSCAMTTRCLMEATPALVDWSLLPRAALGVLCLLAGNGYIVGINQIYDVDIDKINKPFLPVAAGALTPAVAWVLCGLLACGGLALAAAFFGPLITGLYAFGLFLGTIYSVPPLRLKRSPVAAFMIIATVRGFLLNFGVYYAVREALRMPFVWSPPVVFITCFVTLFATVIAITKDLPDVEGDRKEGIKTFATQLGVQNMAFFASGLLGLNYLCAVVLALVPGMPGFGTWNPLVMAGGHALMAAHLVYVTWKLAAAGFTKDAITEYYRGIWVNFYSEYLMFPFI